jgi:hypothetical protein
VTLAGKAHAVGGIPGLGIANVLLQLREVDLQIDLRVRQGLAEAGGTQRHIRGLVCAEAINEIFRAHVKPVDAFARHDRRRTA